MLLWLFSLFFLQLQSTGADPNQKRLLHHLLDMNNRLERPVSSWGDQLTLKFGVSLSQLISVDTSNELLITRMLLHMEWHDYNLAWNESEFGSVKKLPIPPHRIWKPEVLLFNSVDEGFDGTYATSAIAISNGSVFYNPPGIFKSSCSMSVEKYPYEEHTCKLEFWSWALGEDELDLNFMSRNESIDLSQMVDNGDWDVIAPKGYKHQMYFGSDPDPHSVLTFQMILRRKAASDILLANKVAAWCILLSLCVTSTLSIPSVQRTLFGLATFLVIIYYASPLIIINKDCDSEINRYFHKLGLLVFCSLIIHAITLLVYHYEGEMPGNVEQFLKSFKKTSSTINTNEMEENAHDETAQMREKHLKKLGEGKSKITDWQLAATIMDRFCFICILISSVIIFFCFPSLKFTQMD